jgi:hypothetical protein
MGIFCSTLCILPISGVDSGLCMATLRKQTRLKSNGSFRAQLQLAHARMLSAYAFVLTAANLPQNVLYTCAPRCFRISWQSTLGEVPHHIEEELV